VTDPDAMVYESEVKGRERGYALWRRDRPAVEIGMALIFPAEVVSWGNPAVVEDLKKRYQDWQQLGRPGLADYGISFYPAEIACPPPGANEWAVKRKSGTTVFSLKGKANS